MADLSKYTSTKKKSLIKSLADIAATAGNYASSHLIKGVANTLGTVANAANPANLVGIKTPELGAPIKQAGNFLGNIIETGQKTLDKSSGTSTYSPVGQTIGSFTGDVAAQVPSLLVGGEVLKPATAAIDTLKYGKGLSTLLKSVGTTEAMTAASEGRPATALEAGGFGVLDLLTSGIGSKLYKSAFNGTKTEEKNLIKQFGSSVSDVAEKLGYTGTAEGITKQALEKEGSIWQSLVKEASTSKGITRQSFVDVADKIASQFKNLPESEFKSKVIQEVKDAVLQYAPTEGKAITGDQIVSIIEQINGNLFGSGTTVLSPAKVTSLESQIKSEFKNLLPPGVKEKYKDYALNKLIENVMRNEQVKRAVAGSLIIGGSSAGTSIAYGADPLTIVKNTVIGSLVGSISGLTGSTYLKTKGATLLKDKTFLKNLIKEVTTSLEEGNQQSGSNPIPGMQQNQGTGGLSQYLQANK